MSIGSRGVLGTDDDQQQTAWDAQALALELITPQTTAFVSPLIDCSRFGFTTVNAAVAVHGVTFFVSYFARPDGTGNMGLRGFTLDPGVTNPALWSQVNLGPYLKFGTALLTAPNNYTPTIRAMLSNRPHPLVMYPRSNHVCVRHNITLPIGGIATVSFDSYYSGQVSAYFQGGTQGYTIVAQSIAETAGYTPFWDGAVAANTSLYSLINVPMDGCQFILTNNSGVSTCDNVTLVVVANLSGV